jgi:hypothetical protein
MGVVTRAEGWPERLADTIEAALARSFSWSEHNCGLFVADCCKAMTGVDPAAGFLRDARFGDYASARTGLQMEGARGGSVGALAAKIAKDWGAEPVPVAYAQRGDIMALMWSYRPEGISGDAPERARRVVALGICWNGRIAVVTPDGLAWLPVKTAHAAWRIRD